MADDNLDMSNLHLSDDEFKGENKRDDIEAEKKEDSTAKKINRIILLKDLPLLSKLNKKLLMPVKYELNDGSIQSRFIPYDKYFRMLDCMWNREEFGKDADVITMDEHMKDSAPYNVFYNVLKCCPETRDQLYSINFTDLLCPSLGKIKYSFHINFMLDIDWIIGQFARRRLHKLPMTLIYGSECFPWPDKEILKTLYPDIEYFLIEKKEGTLGCHHTKLSIFVYDDDSLRVVIGTANLCADDWEAFNEQIWVSPRCPKLPKGSSVLDGDSPTGFKLALLDYLFAYNDKKISSLNTWIKRIKDCDFKEVKVALLYTVPGVHYPRKNGSFLHFLGHLLSRDCTIPAPKNEHTSWEIVAQTSALGLVGQRPSDWLTTHLLKALGSHKDAPYLPTLHSESKLKFNLIFPSVQNSLNGYYGIMSACCCPYEAGVKLEQPWLLKFKCQWKADETKRSRAMSHSKCYCRLSPECDKMVYYFLTSSNLSRSAWGKIPNQDSGVYVRSYEVGVLFLPKYFGEEYFEIKETPNRKNKRLFPMMFDLPLTPYAPSDDSFCFEELLEKGFEFELSDLDCAWRYFERKLCGESDNDDAESGSDGTVLDKTPAPSSTDQRSVEGSRQVKNENTSFPADCFKDNKEDSKTQTFGNIASTSKSEKKDMKYSGNAGNNMFFPDFKKT